MISKCMAVFLLLITIAMSGCKKQENTLIGNWQLINFNQSIISSYFYPYSVDTLVYKMNDGIIHFEHNGLEEDPYGLFLQMDVEDDSVLVTEVKSEIGLSSTTKTYAGRWIYDGHKVYWGVPSSSHLYNRAPYVNLGQMDFIVETLTDEILVLGSHYRIISADSSELYDNNSTITFLKKK